MRYYIYFFFILVSLIGMNYGCKNSSQPDWTSITLISNPSFEINGTGTLAGWTISDPLYVGLVETAPVTGGRWSLRIKTSPMASNYAYITVAAEQGKHAYKFSFWSKHSGTIPGSVYFLRQPLYGRDGPINGVSLSETLWTFHNFIDTVIADFQDSLKIIMIEGPSSRDPSESYFDLVRLERLD